MQISTENPLWNTLPPTRANAGWIESLGRHEDWSQLEVDALVDLVWNAKLGLHDSRQVTSEELQAACRQLGKLIDSSYHDIAVLTLIEVLSLRWSEPKHIAMKALASQPNARSAIEQIATTGAAWMTRREAINVCADWKAGWQCIFASADDPHWRIRLAVVEAAERVAASQGWANVIAAAQDHWRQHFAGASTQRKIRTAGVWRQLHLVAQTLSPVTELGFLAADDTAPTPPPIVPDDPDPRVLAWELRKHAAADDQELDVAATQLLGHKHEDVAQEARKRLELCSDANVLAIALRWLSDPREAGYQQLLKLINHLDDDRLLAIIQAAREDSDEAIHRWGLIHLGRRCTQWSELQPLLAQLDDQSLAECLDEIGQRSIEIPANALATWMNSESVDLRRQATGRLRHCPDLWDAVITDPDPGVRMQLAEVVQDTANRDLLRQLQQDGHSQVRCCALDQERAAQLIANPEGETSWAVLKRAAYLQQVALPQRTMKVAGGNQFEPSIDLDFAASPFARVVIPGCDPTAPLGISGHYHLPEKGFALAVESGVRLMFFEPNYATMTRFIRSLSDQDRHRIQLVAGTFHADPKGVTADIDRVLRLLRRDCIDLFLMFWVRTWDRVSQRAIDALERARQQGKIANYSLSTHNLSLAADALDRNWAPVMVRHNAAHRSAEEVVLPKAESLGKPVIVFNNTCYGRLLGPRAYDDAAPQAEDCYRFSLSQPGVAACWTAPATMKHLQSNLRVLETLQIEPLAQQRLLARGQQVRRMDHAVGQNIRSID